MLRLAGRAADIVSLNFNNRAGVIGPDGVQSSTSSATAEKIGWVREGAGDRFDALEIEIGAYFTCVMDAPEPALAGMAQSFGLSEEEMRVHPHALFGSPDQRVAWLKQRRYRLPLYVRPALYFLYRYILRLGFLDGKQGFVFHFLQ